MNQQLTNVLKGKTIASIDTAAAGVTLHFADGAVMTVLGSAEGTAQTPAGAVAGVQENGPLLSVTFDTRMVIAFSLSDPGGSVIVRDARNRVVYAG
ncbi:MAG TPA: hypothetical protein VII52_04390 [Gemmatimonadaceae bacterium]